MSCRGGGGDRDEFLNRRSLPAHWHSFEPIDHGGIHTGEDEEEQEILSGRDAVAGGTWLGIHKRTGKFGFLTNVNGQLDEVVRPKDQPPTLASRGLIIQQFLQSDDGVQSYINKLKSNPTSHLMNGYNLILGQMGNKTKAQDGSGVAFFCNRDPEDRDNLFGLMGNNINQALPSASSSSSSSCESTRVYAVSNGIANQPPIWPKVSLAIHAMQDCLKHASRGPHSDQPVDQTRLEMDLFKLLSQTNETTEEVPSNIMVRPHHRHGSEDRSESIETWYGTRTQTILLVSDTVPIKITLVERDAFQIHSSSHPPLASPVWVGDDQSRWRRFQFFLSS